MHHQPLPDHFSHLTRFVALKNIECCVYATSVAKKMASTVAGLIPKMSRIS